MKKNEEVRSIHFTGICGTAMASVAALLKERGYHITGSDDNVYPPMSTFLESRGIRIMKGYGAENLDHAPDLIVIGNALRRGTPEVERALEERRNFCSLPELVREFLIRGKHSIVVTGTHGKTTTTSLLAWVFARAGLRPGFLIGGVPNNFGHGAAAGEGQHFIIEGDEYDTAFFDKRSKFVHYLPDTVVINNIEFDHADIFENLDAVKKAFRHLLALLPRNGLLAVNADDANALDVAKTVFSRVVTFGFGEQADVRAVGLALTAEVSKFTVTFGERARSAIPSVRGLGDCCLEVPLAGAHNVRNALAAAVVAFSQGLTPPQIQAGFSTFQGVRRRLEVRGKARGVTVIDDFAHHPTAISETLKAIRQRYPGCRVWAVFEPRSNTTRRHFFQRELAEALAGADGVVIGKVDRFYELSDSERLDPNRIVESLRAQGKVAYHLADGDAIARTLAPLLVEGDVVGIFSNGSFDGVHEKLLAALGYSHCRSQ